LYPSLQQVRRVFFQQYHGDAVYEGQSSPGLAHIVQQRCPEQFCIPVSRFVQGLVHIQAVALVTTIHFPEQYSQGWP
jgi:hypothetical protein